MNWTTRIPCSKSEPVDDDDSVLSALLWGAAQFGEIMQNGPDLPPDAPPLQAAMKQILTLTLTETDPRLQSLLADLPAAIGSGAVLPALFRAMFSPESPPIAVPTNESVGQRSGGAGSILTPREAEILQEAARGKSRKEIASKLGRSQSTVKNTLSSVFEKLEVDNIVEAVTKASALGIITADFYDLWLFLRESLSLEFKSFEYFFLRPAQRGRIDPWAEQIQRLGAFGLSLFLMASLPEWLRNAHESHGDGTARGVLNEMTPAGAGVRAIDLSEIPGKPHAFALAFAFAPPAAAGHGFTPGNLYVAQALTYGNPLNPISISEFTPEGRLVRSFTGGSHLRSTLQNCSGLTFTHDGRLLTPTASAVLEFMEGGRVTRQFCSHVPYGPLTQDRRGRLYIAAGWEHRSPVCVFEPDGSPVRTVEHGGNGFFSGVAVDDRGTLYVSNIRTPGIEVYDERGRRLASFGQDHLTRPGRLSLDNYGGLYVLDGLFGVHAVPRQSLKRFDLARHTLLQTLEPPPDAYWTDFAVAPNGNLLLLTAVQAA